MIVKEYLEEALRDFKKFEEESGNRKDENYNVVSFALGYDFIQYYHSGVAQLKEAIKMLEK